MSSLTSRRVYRSRVKRSSCRKLRGRTCNKRSNCKYASGSKRGFCRKRKNSTVHRRWK